MLETCRQEYTKGRYGSITSVFTGLAIHNAFHPCLKEQAVQQRRLTGSIFVFLPPDRDNFHEHQQNKGVPAGDQIVQHAGMQVTIPRILLDAQNSRAHIFSSRVW